MGWFGRPTTPGLDPAGSITDFWAWWSAQARDVAASIAAGDLDRHAPELTRHVEAIHPGLTWELGPGTASEHALTLTAEGDPTLRRAARLWLVAAPAADRTWEYHDLRQPSDLDAVLQVGPHEVRLADIAVVCSRQGSGLEVDVYHPAFPSLPDDARAQVMFLALDAAVGEESAELWLDRVEAATRRTDGARPLAQLRGIVAELAEEVRPDGEMSWLLLDGEGPRGPVLVSCLARLRSVLAPLLDEHVAISVPYAEQARGGLPEDASLTALRALEDILDAELGGDGMLVAHETGSGTRTFHYYTTSSGGGADRLAQAARRHPAGAGARTTVELDPAWDAVHPYRV